MFSEQLRGVLTGDWLKNWVMALYFLKRVFTPTMTCTSYDVLFAEGRDMNRRVHVWGVSMLQAVYIKRQLL